jgi:hypothetical protein
LVAVKAPEAEYTAANKGVGASNVRATGEVVVPVVKAHPRRIAKMYNCTFGSKAMSTMAMGFAPGLMEKKGRNRLTVDDVVLLRERKI